MPVMCSRPLPRWHVLAKFICFLTALVTVQSAAVAEEIKSFESSLRLSRDGALDVTEDIVIDFQKLQKHGLLRFVPVTYNRNGGVYVLKLKILAVTDRNGDKLPFTAETLGPDYKIKIGDPVVLVTGVQSYRIHYLVNKAINFTALGPELYWNANGTRWPFKIDNCSVRLHPPFGVKAGAVKTLSFIGQEGSRQSATVKLAPNDTIVVSGSNLGPGENLSVAFRLPQGSISQPTLWDEFLLFVDDWFGLFAWPAVTAVVLYIYWSIYGRDENPVSATSVEWTPPPDLTPAEVGTIIDESCDNPDVLSTLVDLASRGYLKIRAYPASGFLQLGQKNYEFTKTTPRVTEPALKEHEKIFLAYIFPGQQEVSTLSQLKGDFAPAIPTIKRSIWAELAEKKLFARDPEQDRSMFQLLSGGLVIAGIAVLIFLGNVERATGLGVLLSGVIVALSARAMPARTAAGSQAVARCKAFQRFVNTAEKRRIALLAKDDPTIFGRLLPYAIVLGAADKWAHAFQDLMVQPPEWYENSGVPGNSIFTPDIFVADLGDSLHSISAGFLTPPAPMYSMSDSSSGSWDTTAGSGGSGFSDGGGFSGGGFGGGGGGTW